MFTHVAHDLGGSVEPHRLRVKQRAGENAGMVFLDPGAGIDQQGKTGGVTFGKAIAAEPFDLAETARREISVIPVRRHPAHEPVVKRADAAMFLERGQRAAQPIRFVGRKSGTDDGDLHRLFLKKRHAQRLAQNLAQRIGGEADLFLAIPAPDERMHHVALNGAGADNGDLDHQIVKTAWFHAWQKIHLGAAFHLKDANAVGHAQHVINIRVLGRQGCQRIFHPMMQSHQVERLSDTGQHPKAKDIDLENAQRVDIVLVPADDGAVLHCGVLDRDQFIKPPFGHDKAADVLGQVAGKALHLIAKLQRLGQAAVAEVQADFTQAFFGQTVAAPAPKLAGQGRDRILAQSHNRPDFPNGAFAAIMDDRCAQPCAVAAIAFIDVLDHLFAPLVFEIDVDIWRLVSGLGHEPLKHHRPDFRGNRGHAKRVAGHGIGRRPPPLTQDAARARKVDDVVDGQKVRLVFQLGDQGQFMGQHLLHTQRHAAGVAPFQSLPRKAFKTLGRGFAGRDFRGVFISQFIQ